jgi:phosphoribosylanthranilate isomerase
MVTKICGITNPGDALAAAAAGATALGFNFWPGSPRYLTADDAAAILARVPPGVWRVGVFVDEDASVIGRIARRLALDVVQLHGDCTPPDGLRVWRAVAAGARIDASPDVEAWLVDTPAGGQRGGTGRTFDWNLAARVDAKIVLAGGLDAANVADAIAAARPWGVDACSRLESSPGRKDHARMLAFIEAARKAARS